MRIVGEIEHSKIKITLFSWNGKFIAKFELDKYEQTYKISEGDVTGLDEFKKIFDNDFIETIMLRFLQMRTDYTAAFKKNTI
jgi:hypothetical protein